MLKPQLPSFQTLSLPWNTYTTDLLLIAKGTPDVCSQMVPQNLKMAAVQIFNFEIGCFADRSCDPYAGEDAT